MELQLEGKRALVTGSSSGIGEQIARTLAQEGAHVVIHGRNADRAKRVVEDITRNGGRAFVVIGDLSTDQGAQHVAQQAIATFGGIDILVNNAGGSDQTLKGWTDSNLHDWTAMFEQNFFSAVRMIQAIIPHMRPLGWGRVIQIATGWAMQPDVVMPDYGAAKAALVNVTVSLAKELAETGITVNTVSPGPILTPGLERFVLAVAETRGWGSEWADIERNFVHEITPNSTGRIGRVEDIAAAVTFLASPHAGFINGANLRVDGGYVKTIN